MAYKLTSAIPILGITTLAAGRDYARQIEVLERQVGSAATGVTTQGNITANLPDGCSFPVGSAINYLYWDVSSKTPDGKQACVGAVLGQATHCGPCNSQNRDDLMSAFGSQLAVDGQWKTTTTGIWIAGFYLFTTAFDDRTVDYMQNVSVPANDCVEGNDGCKLDPYGTGSDTWLYSRHNNFLSVIDSSTTGCIDNFNSIGKPSQSSAALNSVATNAAS